MNPIRSQFTVDCSSNPMRMLRVLPNLLRLAQMYRWDWELRTSRVLAVASS